MSTPLTTQEETRYAELQQIAIEAARSGNLTILRPMLDAGLAPNLSDHKGNTLIMLASYNDQPQAVQLLMEHGAEVDRRNNRGQTPLAGAAFKGHIHCTRLLIENGANPSAPQGHGQTPISFAAMFGRTEILNILQQATQRHPLRNKLLHLLAQTVHALKPNQHQSSAVASGSEVKQA